MWLVSLSWTETKTIENELRQHTRADWAMRTAREAVAVAQGRGRERVRQIVANTGLLQACSPCLRPKPTQPLCR